jgi:hypothetical protein
MRSYWRQRQDLVRIAVRHIQRIQKALTQMNIRLAGDAQLQQYLAQREDRSACTSLPEEERKRREHRNKKGHPQFDVHGQLSRSAGTDLTQIDGLTPMTVISEAGWDMSKWPSEDHFVSWLRLSPDNRVSRDPGNWQRATAHE